MLNERRRDLAARPAPIRDGHRVVLETDQHLGVVVQRDHRNTFQAQIMEVGAGWDEPIVVCDHAHRTRAGAANCAARQLADVEGER